ncbi:MAG: dTDP-4-dehydrorhamnose reductase [Candidatus Scalindua sp.]|jgi:dTDP-4-dehydrorhamnose reductase|nr:dTDP-4-dehydrorhamnose reductase [Candidatus Scalindua sp.]MBT5307265.1 dTDP-4-dehydrorhamnose reductase [Candidatus Scalindua sp.]MBT6227622.1 dTDP-4-dehydrorhamnose reductase [Candidatus Scalindua sp.]MBT6562055.1 dTDP-4-dehydrorhamnose reductase [Candidatus Scalindua sp.]MBT7210211.1 dTDP-4-dehydrorhamnose reductase [Candidatus Scalindua sp.]
MKILITGSNGMLGTDLVDLLKSRKSSFDPNLEFIEAPHEVLDITLKDKVSEFVSTHTPDIIVNCAAFTNVDKCETEREAAFNVNALGPKYIAAAAKECGARVIHISTDFVFDGNGNRPYIEEDQTNPLSEYGRTKLEGERNIQNYCNSFLIVRASWLFGHNGINFAAKMLELAERNKELSIVTNEIGSPTYTPDLTEALWSLINQGCEGIINVSNDGSCSRYEWAEYIFETMGYTIKINQIKSSEYKRAAKVPLNSTLNCQKFTTLTGIRMRPWKEAVESYLKNQK